MQGNHWGRNWELIYTLNFKTPTFGLSKLRIQTVGVFMYRIKDKAILK